MRASRDEDGTIHMLRGADNGKGSNLFRLKSTATRTLQNHVSIGAFRKA